MTMARKYVLTLNEDEADFIFSLYHTLNIGSPAEKALSDFADALLDAGGPRTEYAFGVGNTLIPYLSLDWTNSREAKER